MHYPIRKNASTSYLTISHVICYDIFVTWHAKRGLQGMYKFYGKTCYKLVQLYMLKANQIIATATWESTWVLQPSPFDRVKADLQVETNNHLSRPIYW